VRVVTAPTLFGAHGHHIYYGFIPPVGGAARPTPAPARRSSSFDSAEEAVTLGSFAVATVLAFNGPFFPPSLIQSLQLADTRRCSIGGQAPQSDCALIGAQWIVTTASVVAAAHPVGGRLHVKIGDDQYVVEQIVYHPKWNGGAKYDMTLVKLAESVRAFPLLPPPGEFPVSAERIAQHAFSQREWVAQTIGPSPLWDASGTTTLAAKPSPLMARVRSLVDSWAGRTQND
jgi:hypothetical protein